MGELYQELISGANKAVRTADHLVYVTYPLVNDVKLLVTITENLNKALLMAMEALLQYEYLQFYSTSLSRMGVWGTTRAENSSCRVYFQLHQLLPF